MNTESKRSQEDLTHIRTLGIGGELGALGGTGELARLETLGEPE